VVPPQFRKEPRLILKIGLNMPVPIPDLHLDDDSMSCTLSFNRSPFYCVVPWSSVFAMVGEDGRGMVWPDDVPQELAVKVVDSGDGQAPTAGRIGAVDPRHGLRDASAPAAPPSVPGPASSSSSPAAASSSSGSSGPRRNGRSKIAADEAPAAAAARTGAGKRKKKKDEESARPVLVAVPREAPEADARLKDEAAGDRDRPREIRQAPEQRRPQTPQPRDGVSAIAQAPPQAGRSGPRQPVQHPAARRPPPVRPTDGEARPKRELPPYLRVVK
jgi:stringent starvation protein B